MHEIEKHLQPFLLCSKLSSDKKKSYKGGLQNIQIDSNYSYDYRVFQKEHHPYYIMQNMFLDAYIDGIILPSV